MSKTIAFWDNSLNERGTSIALYDYAYYNSYRFRVLYEYIEELDKYFPSEEIIINCKY